MYVRRDCSPKSLSEDERSHSLSYPENFICAQIIINPSAWKIYLRANKSIFCATNKMFCAYVEPVWSGAYDTSTYIIQYAPDPPYFLIHFRRSAITPPSLRQPGKMSSPPSEHPLASFDFLSESLPAVDFGEAF